MARHAAIAAALLMAASTPALAQGITGGQLGIEYAAPVDGSDFGGTTYSGGLEYGINRQFSVAVDASGYLPDNLDTDFSSLTLHGIYHLSDEASVGVFAGRDSVEDASANLYGIEGGMELMGGTVEGYIGQVDGDIDDATLFGLSGVYDLRPNISVIGNLDVANTDDTTLSQAAVGAQYQLDGGPAFYAKIGNVTAEFAGDDESQAFIGIGATIAFGAERGTTFDQRSLFEVVPGF